jgi:hypothetical protein
MALGGNLGAAAGEIFGYGSGDAVGVGISLALLALRIMHVCRRTDGNQKSQSDN